MAPLSATAKHVDVLIAGAGIVGLALAIALRQGLGSSFAVAVADPALAGATSDGRATAIVAAARRLFETIGVWGEVDSQPILDMAVTDSALHDTVRPTFLTFAGDIEPGEPFGHMVENAPLVAALVAKARDVGVVLHPVAVRESSHGRLGLLPPPLWGRAGEGGGACATQAPHLATPNPNPSPPQVGPARLAHADAEPGQARVRWGGGRTEMGRENARPGSSSHADVELANGVDLSAALLLTASPRSSPRWRTSAIMAVAPRSISCRPDPSRSSRSRAAARPSCGPKRRGKQNALSRCPTRIFMPSSRGASAFVSARLQSSEDAASIRSDYGWRAPSLQSASRSSAMLPM